MNKVEGMLHQECSEIVVINKNLKKKTRNVFLYVKLKMG